MSSSDEQWWKGKPFTVRPEVGPLFGISFVMGGLLPCSVCREVMASQETGEEPCSDLHYYRVAELAHDAGWIPVDAVRKFTVACPTCARSIRAGSAGDGERDNLHKRDGIE